MASLHELYTELYNKVMDDDIDSQLYYLSAVEDQRKISVEYLLSLGILFIPNNEYIFYYLGDKVYNSNSGLYYGDKCPWTLFVTIPIRDISGTIVGIVGWDAYNKYKELEEGAVGLSTYRVSPSSVFKRESYFLTDVNCLKANFDKGVVFVTDGVFDTISLCYRGIPSVALLGSSFSKEILYFLSWYKHIYVCADNDTAGLKLYQRLKKSISGVHRVIQATAKDIEEALRDDGIDGPKTTMLRNTVNSPIGTDLYIGSERRRFVLKQS